MSFNSNLTISEQERLAYVSGNLAFAQIFSCCDELQHEIDEADDLKKESYDDGFAKGKISVFGVKSAKVIAELQQDLQRALEESTNLRRQLLEIADLFNSNEAKTVSGRKELEKSVRRKIQICVD